MANCPYCSEGHPSAEVLGLKMHRFADRWMPCTQDLATLGETHADLSPVLPLSIVARFWQNLSTWHKEMFHPPVLKGSEGNRIPDLR